MDLLDEDLITLADSGIIRYSALARKTGTALSTVHARMRKLEKDGTIRHYKAEIDWKKAGLPMTSLILINVDAYLLNELKITQDKVLKALLAMPYVKEGYIITGEADIIIKVLSRDAAHLKEILLGHIQEVRGVVKTKTIVILD